MVPILCVMFTCSCCTLTYQRSQFTCEAIYSHADIRHVLVQLHFVRSVQLGQVNSSLSFSSSSSAVTWSNLERY